MNIGKKLLNLFELNSNPWVLLYSSRAKSRASSNIWLDRQSKDPYVKRASKELYRARSAFKLIEIDEKFKFLKAGDVVVDVGAAPGSWTQVAVQRTNSANKDGSKPQGIVIGVDRDDLLAVDGAYTLPFCDITKESTLAKISQILNGQRINSVISDMAPNSIGQGSFDHDAIIYLQTIAFEFSRKHLIEDGCFLCKIWFGDSTKEFMSTLEKSFKLVKLVKPHASRVDSAEIFIFCHGFQKEAQK